MVPQSLNESLGVGQEALAVNAGEANGAASGRLSNRRFCRVQAVSALEYPLQHKLGLAHRGCPSGKRSTMCDSTVYKSPSSAFL
jgi:hypothetical protein